MQKALLDRLFDARCDRAIGPGKAYNRTKIVQVTAQGGYSSTDEGSCCCLVWSSCAHQHDDDGRITISGASTVIAQAGVKLFGSDRASIEESMTCAAAS
jgi:hypothetical protein